MGQNLTQPEEIEQIIKAMAGRDPAKDSPAEGVQPGTGMQNASNDGEAAAIETPLGTEQANLAPELREAHPYVWNM